MKAALLLTFWILLVKSSKINQNSTHYDYHQGTGRIIENYHYLHFNINTTTLLKTYKHIAGTYSLLSTHQVLKQSNLLKQAEILCNEVYQNLQQIIPSNKRTKRGLINGLGTVIKYVFGNPDANDLDKINNYLNSLETQQRENIFTLNRTVSVMNEITKQINNNTNVINENLKNMWKVVDNQISQSNLFEAVITLIIQEQHFLDLLGKIKRSFIFTEQLFDLEILTYEQISNIRKHLLEVYSQKELMLHYHNLLDFRFAQGSIVFTQNSIIYTIKIPILNPIEFSLHQRLATINLNNQTEIITIPWTLFGPSIKLLANKCHSMYQQNYLCQQITAEEAKPIIILIESPLILTYKLSENLTLVSSNYHIIIKLKDDETTTRGTHVIQGDDVQIQGYRPDYNLGELKQSSLISPLIIKDHQLYFEPLKNVIIPALTAPNFKQSKIEFYMSTSSIILVLLLLISILSYLTYKVYKRRNMNQQPTQNVNDEGVFELRQGGVI